MKASKERNTVVKKKRSDVMNHAHAAAEKNIKNAAAETPEHKPPGYNEKLLLGILVLYKIS